MGGKVLLQWKNKVSMRQARLEVRTAHKRGSPYYLDTTVTAASDAVWIFMKLFYDDKACRLKVHYLINALTYWDS